MDNVTHSLTGLFLSRVGLNRFTPYGTAISILSANAPDVDILALAGGSLNYFHFHRQFTHSLLFAPVLAAFAVAIVRVASRKSFPFWPAFLAGLVGIGSHLLLDLTNAYGVRLLLPFSATWVRWDLTNVVDFWMLAFLVLCLIAPFFSNLVGGEIGARTRNRYPGRGFAILAIAFVILYDGGRAILHSRALAILNSRNYGDAAALRVAAFPPGSNPLRWRGLAESQDAYRLYDMDLLARFDPTAGLTLYKAPPSPAIDAASRSEGFRIMSAFSAFPVWRSRPASLPATGTLVRLTDLRFPFFASALVSPADAVVDTRFAYGE